MVRFQAYMLVRESPLTQLPPGKRMKEGCRFTSTFARSGRKPFERWWKVCCGKSETTSSQTDPDCDIANDNRPAVSLAFGTSAREKYCQLVVRLLIVPCAYTWLPLALCRLAVSAPVKPPEHRA